MSNELNQGPPKVDQRDTIDEMKDEISGYLKDMRTWPGGSTDVMQDLASMHARAAEIRHWLHSQRSQKANKFRQNEVNDFLNTCDFQFRIYSRMQSVRQSEMSMSRGFQ